jgi:hypothetical protein
MSTDDVAARFTHVLSGSLGQCAWNARGGHGSFLLLEFGAPSVTFSPQVKTRKMRWVPGQTANVRDVSIRGQHHLGFASS